MSATRWACIYARELTQLPSSNEPAHELLDLNSARTLLAESLMRFSAHVSILNNQKDKEDLWVALELGRSAHIFGGESALLEQIWALCSSLNFQVGLAIADQHQSARILARYSYNAGALFQSPRGRDAQVLSPYPIDCLDISTTTLRFLYDLGVKTLGDLAQFKPDLLGTRLGAQGTTLVQIAQGQGHSPPQRYIPTIKPEAFWDLEPPIVADESLMFVLKRLLNQLCRRLEGQGRGLSSMEIQLTWDYGPDHTESFLLPRPTQDESALLSIVRIRLAEKLPHNTACDELEERRVERVRVQAVQSDIMPERQRDLFHRQEEHTEAITSLVNRLHLMLGAKRVFGAQKKKGYLPEHSWGPVDFIQDHLHRKGSPPSSDFWSQDLPTFLLPSPLPVRGALTPGARLSWSGGCGDLSQRWGPKRIRGSWWERPFARDYFIAEFKTGARVWLFRDLYTSRLYLHGIYD